MDGFLFFNTDARVCPCSWFHPKLKCGAENVPFHSQSHLWRCPHFTAISRSPTRNRACVCARASVPAPGVVAVRAANEPRFPSSPMVSEFVRPWHGRLVRSVWSTKASLCPIHFRFTKRDLITHINYIRRSDRSMDWHIGTPAPFGLIGAAANVIS